MKVIEWQPIKDFEKAVKHNFKVIRNEINEIIDKINKMEDK